MCYCFHDQAAYYQGFQRGVVLYDWAILRPVRVRFCGIINHTVRLTNSYGPLEALLTTVACLQAVEAGILELDKDVSNVLPEVGKYGIMTAFDEEKNEGVVEKHKTPITLRDILSHTSGYEYDWFSPLLAKWRQSRNEQPWTGPTVEHKTTLPLLFEPGTSFRYSGGPDWAGKMIERVTGKTLEAFMRQKVF
ncbi:beta-lactamase/transpeptidase-like protein [Lindgomyces ingoldianus]|uniref:Beta-lactamase/transpeptidase-like protein n=1 Tax=Lindgomyces ingoldianus TaxID=673940 RepID=A0ACB6QRG7_9PLEO|nr:beta-lactamase/transpeptidase-like protein [Lindgomyces ingoldianus]KAF2469573.1 beta-lactamase/transpeptidase-like protein [Lindgomyces ingoldianus]